MFLVSCLRSARKLPAAARQRAATLLNMSLITPLKSARGITSVALLLWGFSVSGQIAAFPGAEGEGMYVTGGRGGDVYHVTNLNDSGAGSLRYGAANAPGTGRTIVFDVAGMIALSSTLSFSRPNITVAGQTAPGSGICLRNYGTSIGAQNIIIRHLRFRPGDASKGPAPGFYGDSLSVGASRVIVDHCSASWGIDECLSAAASGGYDITVQYCFISEGLDQTGLYHDEWNTNYNPGGPSRHSMGSLIKPVSGSGQATYHHNFWTGNGNRNPAVGTYDASQSFKADIRNNTLYNNRNNGYRSEGLTARFDLNYVGNYIIAGPETSSSWWLRAFDAKSDDANFYIYQSGNKIDGDRDLVRDGNDIGSAMFAGTYTALGSPAAMRLVTTHGADEAYYRVINGAGAICWARDSVDARLIQNLRTMKGSVIDSQTEVGGYPVLPVVNRPANWDTDADGMPDYWELATGTDPQTANHTHRNADGYTDLEHYLNWVAELHASGPQDAALDVDLWVLTPAMTNATYSVWNPTNGSVIMQPDGHTARFTPTPGFYGLGNFGFGALDTLGRGMTNTVQALITPTPKAPHFVAVSANDGKITLSAEAGLPYGVFVLKASTSLLATPGDWTSITTNRFDATGNCHLTQTLPGGTVLSFYRLEAL
jgi:hypothetical protein